jgi:hypothetical protein
MHIAPGQQLFYYGSRVWPDNVRKAMYDEFGGMPKDLSAAHDYDPKVSSCGMSVRAQLPARLCEGRRKSLGHGC